MCRDSVGGTPRGSDIGRVTCTRGSYAFGDGSGTCHPSILLSPHFESCLQFYSHPFGDAVTDHIDKLQHVLGRGSLAGNEKVGVPLANFDLADALAFEPALVD